MPEGTPRDGLLERAHALVEAGRYRDARELAREALAELPPPREAVPWRWLEARSLQEELDFEEAAKAWEALRREAARAELAEAAVDAALGVARCRLEMWDPQGARGALRHAPPWVGGELGARRSEILATAAFMEGEDDEARRLFTALEEKTAAAWHNLGLLAFHSAEYEEAIRCFGEAVSRAPRDYETHLYRAWSLLELDRLDAARAAFRQALEIAETYEVYQQLGRLELRASRPAVAEGLFRRALELAPEIPEAHFGLATSLRLQGKLESAREAGKAFQELHRRKQEELRRGYLLGQEVAEKPDDAARAERFAAHYLATGELTMAERVAWKALRLDPQRPEARLCLARALAREGRYAEAALHYQKLLRRDPDHAVAAAELRDLIRKHAKRVDGG